MLCTLVTGGLATPASAQQPSPPPTPAPPPPTSPGLAPVAPPGGSAPAPSPTPAPSAAPAPAPSASPAPAPSATPPPPAPTPPPAPAPAPAAPPTAAQLDQAKKFFTAGTKLMKEGLFQEALASFLEANRIAPRESIQNNLALCYRNLKDFAAAYDAYQALLDKYGDKMKPAARADAEHALEELAVLTGVITITIQEPGAKATIDGKDVGTTPVQKPVRVNMGTHAVSITKDGFEPIAKQVDIKGHDSATVDGPLQKEILTGHVNVTATPADPTAKVLVDGKEVGPAPWSGDLDPGVHQIEVRGEKTTGTAKPLEVAKKGTYDVAVEVHEQQGTLTVNTNVPDAEISVDGKVVGKGVWEGPLPVGQHELSVAMQGYLPFKKPLLVHDGEKLAEPVALQKEQVAAAPQQNEKPFDWAGFYTQFNFIAQLEPGTPSNDVSQGVGYPSNASISGSGGIGGLLNFRLGYSFGFLGIEGSIMGGYDHTGATVNYPESGSKQAYTENWDFHRLDSTFALGLRAMPKIQGVRPELALLGGYSYKGMVFNRGITGPNADNATAVSSFTPVTAPALILDAGIQLGDTPGTFYLGFIMIANFYSATEAKLICTGGGGSLSNPSSLQGQSPICILSNLNQNYPLQQHINVVSGTEVFIGPVLGFQWGH